MKTRKVQHTKSVFDWQGCGNTPKRLQGALKRLLVLREGGLTRHWILTIYHYGRFVQHLIKRSGSRGCVIYLKACHVLLQQVAGGQLLDDTRRLGCAVSRSHSGLPRVIPIYHRKMILEGNRWTVILWSSFFWLYRVLDAKGRIKLSSITKPFEVSPEFLKGWVWWLVQFLPVMFDLIGRSGTANVVRARSRSPLKRGVSRLPEFSGTIPDYISMLAATVLPFLTEKQVKDPARRELANSPLLRDLKPSPVLITKSGPNSAKGPDEGPGPNTRTSIGSILTDILCWLEDPKLLSQIRFLWPEAVNFGLRIIAQAEGVYRELRLEANRKVRDEDDSLTLVEDGNSFLHLGSTPLPGFSYGSKLGKLGFLPEPAGKIRVFAMVDSLTQMLLKPLHDAIFEVLRKIPQDGTHDQHAPALKLQEYGFKHFWSYDLSAATDRFPISLQQALLALLLGPATARAWRSILVDRQYMVPRRISERQRVPRSTPDFVTYGAGQPMGAYTSWAVFALTHHLLVQYAAYRSTGKFQWFTNYALLGDDVVLAHAATAREYLLLLQEIGVEVGLAKSLISRNGTFEFAKKTYRSTTDITGISLAMLGASIIDVTILESLILVCKPKGVKHALRLACRVLGYGGKALTSIPDWVNLRSRLQGLAVLFTRPGSTWGLSPFAWLTQERVDFHPVSEKEPGVEILIDAIRQKLCVVADRSVAKRDFMLARLNNPRITDPDLALERVQVRPSPDLRVGDESGNLFWLPHLSEKEEETPVYSAPYTINTVYTFVKLTKFLTDWVIRPQVHRLQMDLLKYMELIANLEEWKVSQPVEAGFSLDETYRALNDLVDDLEGVETDINKLIRSQVDQDKRKDTKIRSRAVKLWRECHPLVLAHLRKHGS